MAVYSNGSGRPPDEQQLYGVADLHGLIQLQNTTHRLGGETNSGKHRIGIGGTAPKHGRPGDQGPYSSSGDTLHFDTEQNQAKSRRPTGGPPETSMERGPRVQQQHRRGEKRPYQPIRRAIKTTPIWTRAPEHASDIQNVHGDNPQTNKQQSQWNICTNIQGRDSSNKRPRYQRRG